MLTGPVSRLAVHKTTAFTPALFQQSDVLNDDASVHRFAYVINGEQCNLQGSEGFRFHDGWAYGLDVGSAASKRTK